MPFAAESTLPLVQAARQHDTHAWNRLLKQHERALFVYIADIIGNETAALDLIQETLANAVYALALWHRPPKMRPILAEPAAGRDSFRQNGRGTRSGG